MRQALHGAAGRGPGPAALPVQVGAHSRRAGAIQQALRAAARARQAVALQPAPLHLCQS